MARPKDTGEPPNDYERVIQRIQEAKRGFEDGRNFYHQEIQKLRQRIAATQQEEETLDQEKKELEQKLQCTTEKAKSAKQRKKELERKLNEVEQEHQEAAKREKEYLSSIYALHHGPDQKPHCRGKRAAGTPRKPNPKRRRNDDIFNPKEGDACIGYWEEYEAWYVVIILPLAGDFSKAGIRGDITDMPQPIPDCYRLEQGAVTWADGFQEDGPWTAERWFPVISFEDKQDLEALKAEVPREMLDWVHVKDLRPLARRGPDRKTVEGYSCWQKHSKSLSSAQLVTPGKPSIPSNDQPPTRNAHSAAPSSSSASTIINNRRDALSRDCPSPALSSSGTESASDIESGSD
ncbi:hypothetical protein QBC47DRAFT_415012 [Echria macrotheca]|uniref:Uncharacterized protein n=1 Tax=Echria macrotheca TaxID=438768 RepID=A0AAJ0BB83_9PEZI|nr:hypothetical protein QBC47DRAFT_415012 [Echria macrotheca]